MTQNARWMKVVLVVAATLFGVAGQARAAELPLAAASPLTGVAFDDKPLLLPVQRNFQMAMLTAGSELGRTCGRMEAYGWRLSQTEQARVNQIFNNTVDRLRLTGYTITPQNLNSVSRDITLFTADRNDKHFMFLWSAGELGLVLNLCETTAPIGGASRPSPSVQVFSMPMEAVAAPNQGAVKVNPALDVMFTPEGEWTGSYTCAQGYTGGTLQIGHLHGRDFDGEFKFYPTSRNPNVASGSYTVYGQYDSDSRRILINPGKWINHPAHFYNTVMVGVFDPLKDTFSATFQGISGCTSFEAAHTQAPHAPVAVKKAHKKKAVTHKKPVPKPVPPPAPSSNAAPSLVAPPAPVSTNIPAPTPVAPMPPSAAAPAQPAPLPEEDKKDTGGILLGTPGK